MSQHEENQMAEMEQKQDEQVVGGGKPRVFVYGTLKSGEANNPLLTDNDAEKLGDFDLVGPYRMFSLGGYPGVCRVTGIGDATIKGEVWEVSEECLHSLDLLEGHPEYYARSKIPTDYKNAWIYLLPQHYREQFPEVEEGDWRGR
jgi:gamma-glutamylcyclotransferase (GGCT)/AIG2-like uncharacterized protein YtfP